MLLGLRLFSWVVVVGVLLWPVMEGTASFQAAEGRTGEPVIIARLWTVPDNSRRLSSPPPAAP